MVFYNRDWDRLGTKWSLRDEISHATGIRHDQIFNHKSARIAAKMSWAALRTTTRIEDTAYCLLGLFDINMPLLYGEGPKAFIRLQHEILQAQDDDESIFAWIDAGSPHRGILARSPTALALSGNIRPIKRLTLPNRPPIVTKRLLTMDGLDSISEYLRPDGVRYSKMPCPYITLNCDVEHVNGSAVGIELTARDPDYLTRSSSGTLEECSSFLYYFVRAFPGRLLKCSSTRSSTKPCDPKLFKALLIIALEHLLCLPANQNRQFRAIGPSYLDCGFTQSETYPKDAEFITLLPLGTRPEGRKVVLDLLRLLVVAVMFRNKNQETFAVILNAQEFGVNVDVVVPKGTERLQEIIDKEPLYLQRNVTADQSFGHLKANQRVSVTSSQKFMNYEHVYFVDIRISATKVESSTSYKTKNSFHQSLEIKGSR